jgi:hypothetical protein
LSFLREKVEIKVRWEKSKSNSSNEWTDKGFPDSINRNEGDYYFDWV